MRLLKLPTLTFTIMIVTHWCFAEIIIPFVYDAFQGEVLGADLILQTENTIYLIEDIDFSGPPKLLFEEGTESAPYLERMMVFEDNILVSLADGNSYEHPEDLQPLAWMINPNNGDATAFGKDFIIETNFNEETGYQLAPVNWVGRDMETGALLTNPGHSNLFYSYDEGETWYTFPGEKLSLGVARANVITSGNQYFLAHHGWLELNLISRTFDLNSEFPTVSEWAQLYVSVIYGESGIGFVQRLDATLFLTNRAVYKVSYGAIAELINGSELSSLSRGSLIDLETGRNESSLYLFLQETNESGSIQYGRIYLSEDGGDTWTLKPPVIDLNNRTGRWIELDKGNKLIIGFSSVDKAEHTVEFFPENDRLVQFLTDTHWVGGNNWNRQDLGRIFGESSGWYFAAEIGGWFYIDPVSRSWGWSQSLGWFYPYQHNFEYIYLLNSNSYLYHQVFDTREHWQYNFESAAWESFAF